MFDSPSKVRYWLITLGFLIVAAPRILSLRGLRLEIDEVWSVWQSMGSAAEIVAWTPYDWPPLHYLSVGLWKELVGIHPLPERMLSVLVSLLGAAFLYRAARRLTRNEVAALFAVLVYGAMQYSIYIGTLIRGYIFVLALAPLALWLTLRYFDNPTLRPPHGVLLALCMAVMYYAHLTAVLVFAMLGLCTLLVYPRRVLRWALPGVLALALAVPDIVGKVGVAAIRSRVLTPITQPLPEALGTLFTIFTRPLTDIWLLLLVGATILALLSFRSVPIRLRAGLIVIALWVLAPVAFYYLNPVIGFFLDRHLYWVIIGIAVWIGWGVSRLPRAGQLLTAVALIVVASWPLPIAGRLYQADFDTSFTWLAKNMQRGDVILIDPNFKTAEPEEWDYFTRVYFPGGLEFVTAPGNHRRIWYVKVDDGTQDKATQTAVLKNRVASTFIGPWNFLIRLYEAPPDITGILYENGMRFHGAEIINAASPSYPVYREGQTVRLRLWWSADRPVGFDYSVGTQVPGKDGLPVASFDGPPQINDDPRETSRWTPGQYYIEERDLVLPNPLPSGAYPVMQVVYQWWDGKRIGGTGVSQDGTLQIGEFRVRSW